MIDEKTLQTLTANQRFLASELMRRGIEVSVFSWENEVLEAVLGERRELFCDIDSSLMPYAASIIAGSKPLTRKLLERNGIQVPVGRSFSVTDHEEIVFYAKRVVGFPVVVKPSMGNQGKGVHTGLETVDELLHALISLEQTHGLVEILVEEQFFAPEYRVFITIRGDCAVLHRDPAHVIGDGRHSIQQLADAESFRRLNPRKNCLGEVVLDEEAERYLRKHGFSSSSIPAKGEKVYLRGSSNVKMGGVPEDYTDHVHPSVVDIAYRALRTIPGLPYAGVDFMSKDITQPQTAQSYRILELNSVPGIGMHMAPGKGSPRNVAGMIVDLVFPESRVRLAA